jgi:hypothetical protein
MVLTHSGLLGFWLHFRSVTGFFKPAPSRKPRHKPKILAAHHYIFSVNALITGLEGLQSRKSQDVPGGANVWASRQPAFNFWIPAANS